jgi:hypothetical protein
MQAQVAIGFLELPFVLFCFVFVFVFVFVLFSKRQRL